MAQTLGNYLRLDFLLEELAGMGMAEVVKPQVQPTVIDNAPDPVGDPVRMKSRALWIRENEPGWNFTEIPLLLLLVGSQRFHRI